MHERTRRNLCRLAFLALGVLPMVCTSLWTVYRVSPWWAQAERSKWERQLFELTGLATSIQSVEHPTGRSTLLSDLQLVDPDGGGLVARIRHAEIADQPEGFVVLLSQPEVAHGKLLRLWDTLQHRALHGPLPSKAIQITTGELTVEVGQQAQTFKTVRCTIQPHETSVQAALEFQLAGTETPVPAQIRIERNRQANPPTTYWSLTTDAPLPCALFSDYLPQLSQLGPHATFQGKLWVALKRAGWSAELVGRFIQVDLTHLTDSLPHKLSGLATVTINHAMIERGIIKSSEGTLVSDGGTISSSLISSLVQHLPVSTSEVVLASHSTLIHYDRLAFRYLISAEGCSVSATDDQTGGVILSSTRQPLLIGDARARYPLVALVRALSPDSRFLVPATDETKSLLSVLAFPERQPAQNSKANGIQPRVRISNQKKGP